MRAQWGPEAAGSSINKHVAFCSHKSRFWLLFLIDSFTNDWNYSGSDRLLLRLQLSHSHCMQPGPKDLSNKCETKVLNHNTHRCWHHYKAFNRAIYIQRREQPLPSLPTVLSHFHLQNGPSKAVQKLQPSSKMHPNEIQKQKVEERFYGGHNSSWPKDYGPSIICMCYH